MKVLLFFIDYLLGKPAHCSKIKAFLARVLKKCCSPLKRETTIIITPFCKAVSKQAFIKETTCKLLQNLRG